MGEADVLPTLVVLFVGTWGFLLLRTLFSGLEARLLAMSYAAHIVSVFVQLWLVLRVYGTGDLLLYHDIGRDLSAGMWDDFFGVFPEVLRVVLQQDYRLSIFVPAPGTPIATMCGLAGLACFALDDSLLAISVLFSVAAFFGKTALYVALKEAFSDRFRIPLLIATLLVPSTVFWSAGLIKEGVAMAGLGPLVLGLKRISEGQRHAWLPLIVGGLVVALIKPYILMAVAVAAGVTLYWQRSVRRGQVEIRPVTFAIGMFVAVGSVLAIGEVFPRYSLEHLINETARLQAAGFSGKHGSNYVIGDPTNLTLLGQLVYAPWGLFTALYRPLVFEAHNAMMFVNALETSAFLGLTVWAGWSSSARRAWKTFVQSPLLVFCLLFVVLLGIPVGLTSANLGTLSRYRIPLVPFQAALLVVLGTAARVRSRPAVRTPQAAPWLRQAGS